MTVTRLRVDWPTCEARGLCAELLPELIAVDEWGYPVVDGRDLPVELLDRATEAARACPYRALRLVRAPAPVAPTVTTAV